MDQRRREFFRIHFPELEQPQFSLKKLTFNILDLSEGGMAFSIDPINFDKFIIGKDIKVEIKFKGGEVETVTGQILRFSENDNKGVMKFSKGVSQKLMAKEQIRLLAKYGAEEILKMPKDKGD